MVGGVGCCDKVSELYQSHTIHSSTVPLRHTRRCDVAVRIPRSTLEIQAGWVRSSQVNIVFSIPLQLIETEHVVLCAPWEGPSYAWVGAPNDAAASLDTVSTC